MLEKADMTIAEWMHGQGKGPAEILRYFAATHPQIGTPDLMDLMQRAFSLSFDSVLCIGGWWHDGTSELSDEQLDSLLIPAIQQAYRMKRTR